MTIFHRLKAIGELSPPLENGLKGVGRIYNQKGGLRVSEWIILCY